MVEIVVVDNSVLMPFVYSDEDYTGPNRLILAGASSVKLLYPTL